MISKNNGGAAQPVSRPIDSGGEAYAVGHRARRPSTSGLNIVCADIQMRGGDRALI
jgi:hypothetical protein